MNAPIFDATFSNLPSSFFSAHTARPVASPHLIRLNEPLAELLGVDPAWLSSDDGLLTLAGNRFPDSSRPIATKYGGHQFGHWNPDLGDGRAVLIGEVVGSDGERYDVQLKGSGPTQYSRGGDGRSPIGPVLREYVVSEAMHALRVPTTRSLAAVTTGDLVIRKVALPGAVLTRVAKSHIRVGTFEYFAAHESDEDLNALLQYTIARHDPDLVESDNPPLEFLKRVVQRQAALISQWQSFGFVHGVMNTDNMLVSGETIDYGPCAFIDDFSIDAVFSSIDTYGRYAYKNQPVVANWNLAQLARALIVPISEHVDAPTNKERREGAAELATAVVESFSAIFEIQFWSRFSEKLGLFEEEKDDQLLISDLLEWMDRTKSDFTLTFRALNEQIDPAFPNFEALYTFPESATPWLARWRERLEREPNDERGARMHRMNPLLIPRNHRVEEAIVAAESEGDFAPFHSLVDALESPFAYSEKDREYALPPKPDEVVTETFCGT